MSSSKKGAHGGNMVSPVLIVEAVMAASRGDVAAPGVEA
jgi:hypothetical protein